MFIQSWLISKRKEKTWPHVQMGGFLLMGVSISLLASDWLPIPHEHDLVVPLYCTIKMCPRRVNNCNWHKYAGKFNLNLIYRIDCVLESSTKYLQFGFSQVYLPKQKFPFQNHLPMLNFFLKNLNLPSIFGTVEMQN